MIIVLQDKGCIKFNQLEVPPSAHQLVRLTEHSSRKVMDLRQLEDLCPVASLSGK
jgi:hypothetical protein